MTVSNPVQVSLKSQVCLLILVKIATEEKKKLKKEIKNQEKVIKKSNTADNLGQKNKEAADMSLLLYAHKKAATDVPNSYNTKFPCTNENIPKNISTNLNIRNCELAEDVEPVEKEEA